MLRIHPLCGVLPLVIACGGGESTDLFTRSNAPGTGTAGAGSNAGASAGAAASFGGTSGGSGASDPGGASQGASSAGGAPTGGIAGTVTGSGGAGGTVRSSGGAAGTGGSGGAVDPGGTAGAGGAPIALPTGATGFPTNAPECPPELPLSSPPCTFGLACQYPGMLCTCGLNSVIQCVPQQNQCLDQSHCSAGFCHPALHVCTECIEHAHCLDVAHPLCRADGVCVQCLTNAECSGLTPVCGFIPFLPSTSSCVQCQQDSDCSDGMTCDVLFGVCQTQG